MMTKQIVAAGALAIGLGMSTLAFGHGDVAPQPVDTTGLEPLGDEWRAANPYRDNDTAITIGKAAYGQNCARCHGLDAVSGGIAPDLRKLDRGELGDEWFQERVRNGAVRNGAVYMPKFALPEGPLSQEALWAIRSWLDTVAID